MRYAKPIATFAIAALAIFFVSHEKNVFYEMSEGEKTEVSSLEKKSSDMLFGKAVLVSKSDSEKNDEDGDKDDDSEDSGKFSFGKMFRDIKKGLSSDAARMKDEAKDTKDEIVGTLKQTPSDAKKSLKETGNSFKTMFSGNNDSDDDDGKDGEDESD